MQAKSSGGFSFCGMKTDYLKCKNISGLCVLGLNDSICVPAVTPCVSELCIKLNINKPILSEQAEGEAGKLQKHLTEIWYIWQTGDMAC